MRAEAGAVEAVVTGGRHLKVWVSDLGKSRRWYEQVFGLEHVLDFEDLDGVVRGMTFRVPHASFELALRENPRLAGALYDADPFALATTREALDAWVQRLDDLGIPHSPIVLASRGFALGFQDPDGLQVRLYADDPEVAPAGGRTRVSVPTDTVRPAGG
jgi:catechol-2,3-dioxygenase